MNIYKTKFDDEIIFVFAETVDESVKKIKEYYPDFSISLGGPFIYKSTQKELAEFSKKEHCIIGRP